MQLTQSNLTLTLCTASAFALMTLVPQRAMGQSKAESKSPFDAVAFMVGHWSGQDGQNAMEEVWSEPSGDNMMGMFRFVQGGAGAFYEFMLIENGPEGLVLRIKHFNAGLIGWEEREEVHEFPLTSATKGNVVFEKADGMKRIRYVWSEDELVAAVEDREGDEWKSESFRFRRVSQ